jgi:hypothetical protein
MEGSSLAGMTSMPNQLTEEPQIPARGRRFKSSLRTAAKLLAGFLQVNFHLFAGVCFEATMKALRQQGIISSFVAA